MLNQFKNRLKRDGKNGIIQFLKVYFYVCLSNLLV